jgi:hypothetical protein
MAIKSELQAKATELGLSFSDTTTVPQLKELIAAQAGPATATPSNPVLGKAERMRQHLEAQPKVQPKVPIMIPLTPGEIAGSTESVILNGYRLNIRKGEYVHVPEQVARVIMESQQQTAQAINNYFLMNADGKSAAMKRKEA